MKNKGFVHIVLIVLVVAIGIAGIGYFMHKKNSVSLTQVSNPAIFITQKECEKNTGRSCYFENCDNIPKGKTAEEICGRNFKKGWVASKENLTETNFGNWKTYSNAKYGFDFKYPNNFKITKEDSYLKGFWLYLADEPLHNNLSVNVSINPKDSNGTLITVDNFDSFFKVSDDVKVEKLQFAGKPARKIVLHATKKIDGKEVIKETSMVYYILDSNKVITLQGNTDLDILYIDQILSTFRFVNTGTITPTCIPRPACLDATPRCMIPETDNMCPPASVQPIITSPTSYSIISSPLKIKGTVPAGWMFEGVFPLKLLDANKNVITQGQAKETVPGSWQSGMAVDFEATLTFSTTAKSGYLLLENDNPSGIPENSKFFDIPIKFK
jgi:hypothetical protein